MRRMILLLISFMISSCSNVFKNKHYQLKNKEDINIGEFANMELSVSFSMYFGERFFLTYSEAKKDYITTEITSESEAYPYLTFDNSYINELFSLAENFLTNYFYITKDKLDILFSTDDAKIKQSGIPYQFEFVANFYSGDFTGIAKYRFKDGGFLILDRASICFPSDEIIQDKYIYFEHVIRRAVSD